jgi:hypothetical protein
MSKLRIIIGAYNHLPIGATEARAEKIYDNEIKPLISALYKAPRVNLAIHYSGMLLHWIERRRPELFMLLETLIARKQAEILGGGFYEPMMPLLPPQDKIGQIEMLTTYLRKQFGKKPTGCWIPALAWEQNLVGALKNYGLQYTFLDERQFLHAGIKAPPCGIFQPCITEDQGKIITVFPISKTISDDFHNFSFDSVEKAILRLPKDGEELVTVFPSFVAEEGEDAEAKFSAFFEELSKTDAEFTLPGKIYKSLSGLKKVYFACTWQTLGSGREINTKPRDYIASSPEANAIYAKTVFAHTLINDLRGDKSRKKTALEELWKAQDCDIYRSLGNSVRKAA